MGQRPGWRAKPGTLSQVFGLIANGDLGSGSSSRPVLRPACGASWGHGRTVASTSPGWSPGVRVPAAAWAAGRCGGEGPTRKSVWETEQHLICWVSRERDGPRDPRWQEPSPAVPSRPGASARGQVPTLPFQCPKRGDNGDNGDLDDEGCFRSPPCRDFCLSQAPAWGFPSLYLHPNPFPHCQPPWLSLPRLPLP